MGQLKDRHSTASANPPAQPASARDSVSDFALAQAVAQAVRETPDVIDLSPGRFVLAATYSKGQHVTGVVVHHPRPGAIRLEVHAVLSGSCSSATAVGAGEDAAGHGAKRQAVLTEIGEQIRRSVYRVANTMSLPALAGVDVYIDDLIVSGV